MSSEPLAALRQRLADDGLEAAESLGLLVLELPAEAVRQAVEQLKTRHGFDLFLDVTAVDWPGRQPRFDVVWHLYSTALHLRVRVKTTVAEDDPTVDSLVPLYNAARFMERECHDMFGIVFRGNADLRPILLYEGFVGHPLRKDYPKNREQPLVRYRR